jgi:hypothetical protein
MGKNGIAIPGIEKHPDLTPLRVLLKFLIDMSQGKQKF